MRNALRPRGGVFGNATSSLSTRAFFFRFFPLLRLSTTREREEEKKPPLFLSFSVPTTPEREGGGQQAFLSFFLSKGAAALLRFLKNLFIPSAPHHWRFSFKNSQQNQNIRPRTPSSAPPLSARPGPSRKSPTGARRAPRPPLRSPCSSTAPTWPGPSRSCCRGTRRRSPPRCFTRRSAAAWRRRGRSQRWACPKRSSRSSPRSRACPTCAPCAGSPRERPPRRDRRRPRARPSGAWWLMEVVVSLAAAAARRATILVPRRRRRLSPQRLCQSLMRIDLQKMQQSDRHRL